MEKPQRNKALEEMVNAHIEAPPMDEPSHTVPIGGATKTKSQPKAGAIARLEAAKFKATRKVPVMGHVSPEVAAKVESLASRYHVSKSEAVAILLEEALTQIEK